MNLILGIISGSIIGIVTSAILINCLAILLYILNKLTDFMYGDKRVKLCSAVKKCVSFVWNVLFFPAEWCFKRM